MGPYQTHIVVQNASGFGCTGTKHYNAVVQHNRYIYQYVHFVQVLSTSVADAFSFFSQDETSETENFVRKFDRFFDCMNVRCYITCFSKRKPDLCPYRSVNDKRLSVSVHSKSSYPIIVHCDYISLAILNIH